GGPRRRREHRPRARRDLLGRLLGRVHGPRGPPVGGRAQPALDDPRGRLGRAAGMTRRLAIAAMAVGIPLLGADAAMACSCAPINVREQLKASDGAFVGRLVAIREVNPPAQGEPTSSADPVDYVYRVGRVYNGG